MKFDLKIFIFVLLFSLVAGSTFQLDDFVIPDMLLGILYKIAFFVSIFMYIIYRKQNRLLYLMLIFFMTFFAISYVRGQEYIRVIPIFMKVSSFLMLCDLYCEKYNKDVINILFYVFTSIVYLNFFFMIFFDGIFGFSESGMTRYLITSNHNQFAATLIPTLLVAHVRYYYKANKMSLLILHIIAVLTVLIPGSMTATVSILLWIIYFYFFRASRFKKIVIYCIAGGIIFFFIIFILLPSYKFDNNLVSGFVEFIGKDMTFSNRTVIWIRTIAEIIEKPIMGEGLYSREWGEVYIGSINAHNIILQLLLQGGVILLSLFSILLGYVIKKIVKHDNIEYKLLVLISIVLFFLMSMFEVYNYNMLFIYIIILYVASFYENEYEIS